MWTYHPRRLFGSLVVLGMLGAFVTGTRGQNPPPLPGEPKKKDKAQSLEVMIFPTDRFARDMIRAVNDYLVEFKDKPNAPWDKICYAAQQVLDAKSDSFVELPSADGKTQRVSAKAEANRLISQFPKDGKQFYQLTFGPTADKLLGEARDRGYDRGLLAELSQRFFHTRAGATATLQLAGLQLERGDYTEAVYSFDRLFARTDIDDLITPLTVFKAMAAYRRGGEPAKSAKLLPRLEKSMPRDGLKIGRRTFTTEELTAELNRPTGSLFGLVSDAYVSVRMGNSSHTGVGDGGPPFLDPKFVVPMTPRTDEPPFQDGSVWIQQNLNEVLKNVKPGKGDVVIPGSFPLTAQNLVFFRTYDGIYAYVTKDGFSNHGRAAKAGELYWIAEAKGCLSKITGDDSSADAKNRWVQFRDNHKVSSLLYENPLLGSMTHDGVNLYVIDDTALPPPPPNQNQEQPFGMPQPANNFQFGNGADKEFADGNRLSAINIVTGGVAWTLGKPIAGQLPTEEQEDKETNPLILLSSCYFLGPPLAINGKLYVLFEKNGRIRLACLDAAKVRHYDVPNGLPSDKSPELLWSQRLGEPNTKLPTDAIRRFQCSHLSFSDGVMICPTNAGSVVAVDVMSRSLLWARSYRSISVAQADDPNQNFNGRGRFRGMGGGGGTGMAKLTTDRWRSATPIIARGRVVFAAYDSDTIDCYDLRTGDLLWSEPRAAGDLYVGGVIADNVLIVSRETVRSIALNGKPNGKPGPGAKEDTVINWRDLRIGTPAGHGVASKDNLYYLPLADSPDGTRPEVWAIDVVKGEVTAKAAYRRKADGDTPTMLGNLTFHEGQLISQSPIDVTVFPLIGFKKQEMGALLQANPNDPVGLVARGELLLDNGDLAAAIADFKAAMKNNPPPELLKRLQGKLYSAYTELLRRDFATGEPFLAEYKALCDVPPEAEEPKLRQQQIDEQFLRKKLYLELVAMGRERQGRLTDAFDHYREFAALGANKQLVTIHTEAYGETRPDVWARGRIEAMIRSASAEARKPLEDRVTAEARKVLSTDTIPALREFVGAFGDHFPAGREVQLRLAERLLATPTDENNREAQQLLQGLAAEPTATPVAAQAVEQLARLMTRRGLMDDAVQLYTTLGTRFGAVPVRNDKTGADLYNDVLTDKRLLAYLEPARLVTPAKVSAKRTAANPAAFNRYGMTVEPDGAEDNPFLRRHRLLLVNDGNDNSWTLFIVDKATGQDRGRFSKLKIFSPNGVPSSSRLVTVQGQLALVHGGGTVYCLDLAEKKELWQYQVLGDMKFDPNTMQFAQPIGRQNEANEFLLTLNVNGSELSIGRTAIVQPNYVCLITRDGIVALDPLTRSPLWKRTNIRPASIVFGDRQHVFVVETDGGRPKSRVFRASDGTPVNGVPEFGTLVTGKARQRFIGRNVLLFEGDGQEARTLRLYDPLTGTDIWKTEQPAGTLLLQCPSHGQTGVLKPNGVFEVRDAITGKVGFTATVPAELIPTHLKETANAILLADADRYFLVLNKPPANNRANSQYLYSVVRTLLVNGPVCCFDRTTSESTWYAERTFLGQQLVVERFAELPALISGTSTILDDGTQQQVYRVLVMDKQNGRLRYAKNDNNTGVISSMTIDPRQGTAGVYAGQWSLEIGPDGN